MPLDCYVFPSPPLDNYGFLLHSAETGETVSVDAGHAQTLLDALDKTGWMLSELWVTHHDRDHTAGIEDVKSKTNCHVIGPKEQPTGKISGLDQLVSNGDEISFAGSKVQIIHTPGHTLDLINYYLPEEKILFASDTLFVMGCGRVKEGTLDQMWQSLEKLMALPDDTIVYCAHEYTKANAEFALTIDPDNEALKNRYDVICQLLDKGESTVPTMMSVEKATNPFLRVSDPLIRKRLNMENASDAEVFAEIRKRKDNF